MTLMVLLGIGGPGCETRTVASSRSAEVARSAPDTTWLPITGPTLVAFHPIATDAQLEGDSDLAMVLDQLSFHLGSAMPTLTEAGVAVHHIAGDTVKLWLSDTVRWVRPADGASVGYLLIDPQGRRATMHGLRMQDELIASATAFARTGRIGPP